MGAHVTPQKRLAVLQDIMAGQLNRIQLATANKCSVSLVDRMRYAYSHRNGKTLAELAGIKPSTNGTTPLNPQSEVKRKIEKVGESIRALRATGMTLRAIAAQLHVSNGMVAFHLYTRPKLQAQAAKKAQKTKAIVVHEPHSQNGGQISGINKHVYVGIYVAEAERLGHHIGERFGISSDFLRSGLSEFLEHTKIRRAPRDGD